MNFRLRVGWCKFRQWHNDHGGMRTCSPNFWKPRFSFSDPPRQIRFTSAFTWWLHHCYETITMRWMKECCTYTMLLFIQALWYVLSQFCFKNYNNLFVAGMFLQYIYMLQFILKDGSDWLCAGLWRQEAVSLNALIQCCNLNNRFVDLGHFLCMH